MLARAVEREGRQDKNAVAEDWWRQAAAGPGAAHRTKSRYLFFSSNAEVYPFSDDGSWNQDGIFYS
jgi:hypothetical protein